jgi:ParB family chromosome partitioning protein
VAEPSRDRRGLGRGLSALLGDGPPAAGAPSGAASLVELPLASIAPNPDQPRAAIEPEALAALAASIRATGILQPVVVRPADPGGTHRLIAGERRWRAAELAGLERVPAVVRPVDARESLELALVENLVREDLNPIDVAQACACLIEDFGQSQTELAERLGRSRPAISNLVRLLELPAAVQDLIVDGSLTEGHGRAILMADGPARRIRVAEAAVAEGLSVRATEARARDEGAARPRRAPRPEPTAIGDAALQAFGTAFDTPVRVRPARDGQVVVELRFADEAALEAALGRLSAPSGA